MRISYQPFCRACTCLIMVLLLFPACRKKIGVPIRSELQMNVDEAFALVEGALAKEAEGLMSEILNAIDIYTVQLQQANPNPHCELSDTNPKSDVFDNNHFTGTYAINQLWIMNCDGQRSPENLTFSWEGDITYHSTELSVIDYTDGNLNLSRLDTEEAWLINGTYERTGGQISNLVNHSFETTLFITLTDLVVDLDNRESRSGSGSVKINGMVINGRPFSINGDIVFPENGAAEVTIGTLTAAFYPF